MKVQRGMRGNRLVVDRLFSAIEEHDARLLSKIFRDFRVSPYCSNQGGDPLLIYAVKNGFTDGVKIILSQKNTIVNLQNTKGETALHVAAEKGNLAVLRLLIKNGGKKEICDKKGLTPLHYAVKKKRIKIASYLVELSVQDGSVDSFINAVGRRSGTPLFHAIDDFDIPLIKMLIRSGAIANIPNFWGYTDRALVVFKGYGSEILNVIPSDPYTEEFIQRKLLAHVNCIGGKSCIDGVYFSLTGGFTNYMHQIFYEHMVSYFKEIKNDSPLERSYSMIFEAFEQTMAKPSCKEISTRISQRQLTIFPAEWYGHYFDLVFFNGYLAICNRGERDFDQLSMRVFKIDPDLVTEDVVKKIESYSSTFFKTANFYFYKKLPFELMDDNQFLVQNDPFCTKMESLSPKDIKEGICSYAAPKAAFLASLLFLKMLPEEKKDWDRIGKECKMVAKEVSVHARIEQLRQYIAFDRSGDKRPPDPVLVQKSHWKVRKNIKRLNGDAYPILNSRFQSFAHIL